MTPLLSIVVPVHAASLLEASYVDWCLRSLSGDRLPVEVIAVDDGSPVPVGSYPGVRTVRRLANRGLGAARNLGLSLVSGGYVWFVDGDDIVPPGADVGPAGVPGQTGRPARLVPRVPGGPSGQERLAGTGAW